MKRSGSQRLERLTAMAREKRLLGAIGSTRIRRARDRDWLARVVRADAAISTLLFGVAPNDPLTFASVSMILLGSGVLASWHPGRRATRIDPIAALRSD